MDKNKIQMIIAGVLVVVFMLILGQKFMGNKSHGKSAKNAKSVSLDQNQEVTDVFSHLTVIRQSGVILGEQKSKAAQLGITSLMAKGIQPNIIACRCSHEVTQKVREKIR